MGVKGETGETGEGGGRGGCVSPPTDTNGFLEGGGCVVLSEVCGAERMTPLHKSAPRTPS